MDLLILLVERRRQLVTRVDIVDRLWGKSVFVDVETGVNTVISKVRQVRRDSPSASTCHLREVAEHDARQHFSDQLATFREFRYKPLHFYRHARRKE